MILISHPRSGSDWFLRGLLDFDFSRTEIFSRLNAKVVRPPDGDFTDESPFKTVSFNAKLLMLKHMPITRCQKIHLWDLSDQIMNKENTRSAELIQILKGRPDLYFLSRRNIRAQIVSHFVARVNNNNFHGESSELTLTGEVQYSDFFEFYRTLSDTAWVKNAFKIREHFVFEDLLSGEQIPNTVRWDPSKSDVQRRGSMSYKSSILNFDQLVSWMDDLNVPGNLNA